MLMKQVDHNGAGNNVRFGDSLTADEFAGETFDYFLTNPPFGVDWKKQQKEIKQEHDKRGLDGRFGAGLPRVNGRFRCSFCNTCGEQAGTGAAGGTQTRLAARPSSFSGSPPLYRGRGLGREQHP